MTCVHVLGLIDAGALAGYPPAHMEAAREHARQCPTCGPALFAAEALADGLTRLANPLPPSGLSSQVLARIEQLQAAREAAQEIGSEDQQPHAWTDDWPMWAAAAGAILTVLAIAVLPRTARWTPLLVAFGSGDNMTAPGSAETTVLGALVLVAALLVYVGGLFSPARIGAIRGGRD